MLCLVKRQKNPCIDICKFSGPHDWCIGCGRTRLERKKWKNMKKKAKKKQTKKGAQDGVKRTSQTDIPLAHGDSVVERLLWFSMFFSISPSPFLTFLLRVSIFSNVMSETSALNVASEYPSCFEITAEKKHKNEKSARSIRVVLHPVHNTARHGTTRHDTARHDTTRHDTTRHDTTYQK